MFSPPVYPAFYPRPDGPLQRRRRQLLSCTRPYRRYCAKSIPDHTSRNNKNNKTNTRFTPGSAPFLRPFPSPATPPPSAQLLQPTTTTKPTYILSPAYVHSVAGSLRGARHRASPPSSSQKQQESNIMLYDTFLRLCPLSIPTLSLQMTFPRHRSTS